MVGIKAVNIWYARSVALDKGELTLVLSLRGRKNVTAIRSQSSGKFYYSKRIQNRIHLGLTIVFSAFVPEVCVCVCVDIELL